MKLFQPTKMTPRKAAGLACVITGIITVLVTISLCENWFWYNDRAKILLIGSLIITGLSIAYRYWLLILLPIWIFFTMPMENFKILEITNNQPDSCSILLIAPKNQRMRSFDISPDETKRCFIPLGENEFHLIYKPLNQPEKFVHIPDTNIYILKAQLGTPASQPAKMGSEKFFKTAQQEPIADCGQETLQPRR